MSLHLIEAPIALRDLHFWAGARNLGGGGVDEGVVLHHLLGETFGPAALQPFRLLVAEGGQAGTLYAYADQDASALRQTALASQTPGQEAVIRLDRLRSIPRPVSVWREGQRLGFDVRLRPVVRLHSELVGHNEQGEPVSLRMGAEVDAFLARSLRTKAEGLDLPSREAVYLDWLGERLVGAARLERETTRLAGFRRQVAVRKGRRLEGPDATVHGTLVVTDPEAFAGRLAAGIGRHRAYGYGMLLLRPPQRPKTA
ncbi:CRISPR system Cascade subunit CasE [Angulomicrobium tetraedrale]|uniref:CRISPR system Cascade subunit CasE n=1 Tax=Ancylobacter tetraedralis TaxID=217068 RepID=A0A839ZA50_9HYPH|nr:type I-E CRISPR-associated protein Cas6/Cse3/CasE [Ancylobacter tetraedralis]MBB3771614.1 CRISPR system Cascade subunit CasE [Ancylobacter tetraedralis]